MKVRNLDRKLSFLVQGNKKTGGDKQAPEVGLKYPNLPDLVGGGRSIGDLSLGENQCHAIFISVSPVFHS